MSESENGPSSSQQLIDRITELEAKRGFLRGTLQQLVTAVLGGLIMLGIVGLSGLVANWHLEGGAVRMIGGWSRADISTAVTMWDCTEYVGACGEGLYQQPTYYLDRVRFTCQPEHPVMQAVRFERCGEFNTPAEGLRLIGTCCALSVNPEERRLPR